MDVVIHLAADRLTAVLDLPAGQCIDALSLKAQVARHGIVYGLDCEAVVAATQMVAADRHLVLARGLVPQPGQAAVLEPLGVPGTVVTGALVGHLRAGTAGQPGIGVDAQAVPAPPAVPLALGRGLGLRADGGVVATRDGLLLLVPQPTVAIPGVHEEECRKPLVQVDTHDLHAWLDLAAGEYVRGAVLAAAMTTAGVHVGVDAAAVAAAEVTVDHARKLPLARGTPPVDGGDAHLEVLIDERAHLRIDAHNHADFHELDLFHDVVPGQPLGRLHPPTAGRPGLGVRGRVLPAKAGKAIEVGALLGEGTRPRTTDPALIEAAAPGIFQHDRQGRLLVLPLLTITGDVNLKTGNIDTTLPVLITGDIKAGFAVKSGADITVLGAIEDARVTSQANLSVRGGILAGQQRVKAHGAISARYAEGRQLKAGTVAVSGSLRHCTVLATATVQAKEIVGGEVIAALDITCEVLGSGDGQRTRVQVGVDPFAESLHRAALAERERLIDEAVQRRQRCKVLGHHLEDEHRHGGDPHEQELAHEVRAELDALTATCARIASCDALIAAHDRILARAREAALGATVQVRGLVHPFVDLAIGEHDRIHVESALTGPLVFHLGEKDGTKAVVW